jgi:chromosome segregation ATPase
MAGKLKDDQIRWILSLDAKGVQGELQTLSSTIKKLSADNASMKKEMAGANKQMSEAAKEMQRLEKEGKTTSVAYQEAKATFESAKAEIASYTQRISENNKAIEENKNKTSEIIEIMKIEDMTMSQLRQRANELQRQLNNTSLAADPEAYESLQRELDAVRDRMSVVGNSQRNLLELFAEMQNPIGTAARAIQGFGQALKVLIANPVGVVIMAIAAAFYALKTAISGSDEASTKLSGVLKALSGSCAIVRG